MPLSTGALNLIKELTPKLREMLLKARGLVPRLSKEEFAALRDTEPIEEAPLDKKKFWGKPKEETDDATEKR